MVAEVSRSGAQCGGSCGSDMELCFETEVSGS